MKKQIIGVLILLIIAIFGTFFITKSSIKPVEIEVEKEIIFEKEIISYVEIEKEVPLQLLEISENSVEVCGSRLASATKLAEAAQELGYENILILAQQEIERAEQIIEENTIPEEEINEEEETAVFAQPNPDPEPELSEQTAISYDDAVMLAQTIYREARGIASQTEQACIVWTVLNRIDAGWYSSVYSALTAPGQFAYDYYAPTIDDYGRDLITLAQDVLNRWYLEHSGVTEVGRVLPSDYMWYAGDGYHNYFRNSYLGGTTWDYSWGTPYSS